MSKSKKKPSFQEKPKENEAPAHRSRREAQKKIERYIGPVADAEWGDDEEFSTFEPIKKRTK